MSPNRLAIFGSIAISAISAWASINYLLPALEERQRQSRIEASLTEPILDFDVFTATEASQTAMSRYPGNWPDIYRRQAAIVESSLRRKLITSRKEASPEIFRNKSFSGEYRHGDVLCKWVLMKNNCKFRIAGPDQIFGTGDDYSVEF